MQKQTVGYIALLVILAASSVLSLKLYFRERNEHDVVDVRKFPVEIGEWKGKDVLVTDTEYKILETHNLVSREYFDSKGETIYLFIIYSETNRSVFHPPEVCMIGEGMEMVNKTEERLDAKMKKISANKLSLQKNNYKQLALYCYKAGNLYTSNFYLQQVYLAMHQVFGKNVPGATIRVSTSLSGAEEEAVAALKEFLVRAIGELEKLH